jgi:hypothetical protein
MLEELDLSSNDITHYGVEFLTKNGLIPDFYEEEE